MLPKRIRIFKKLLLIMLSFLLGRLMTSEVTDDGKRTVEIISVEETTASIRGPYWADGRYLSGLAFLGKAERSEGFYPP